MNIKTFITALATLPLMAACGGQTETDETAPNNSLKFETVAGHQAYILEDTAQEFDRDSDLTVIDSAAVILPVELYDNDIATLRDSIMRAAFDTVCPDPADAMRAFFDASVGEMGYTAVATDDAHLTENDTDGQIIVCGDIYSLSDARLTYRIAQYTYYPGAAHGMTNIFYINYDLRGGDIIDLDEIFTPRGLQELPALISRRARKLANQLGPTSISSLPAGNNFYISLDDEIVFVYQPYEVASFAQGAICVPFYPYELSEYMTQRGLNTFSLNN